VQDNVVVAMVLLWRVAYDVVVEEGHRASLWRVGLWRDYIEGVNFGVGCREEGGLGKRHWDLDPIHPDHLEAGRRPGLIAIREARGLGTGNGRQDKCQGGDGHYGNADADGILEMCHFPNLPCWLLST